MKIDKFTTDIYNRTSVIRSNNCIEDCSFLNNYNSITRWVGVIVYGIELSFKRIR
jgi:hypothetical protein